jgi:class 3 adenylate cyclase
VQQQHEGQFGTTFHALLERWLLRPRERPNVERRIDDAYGATRAVMLLDLCGFSRTTRERGIVAFLALIVSAQRIVKPLVEEHAGTIVEKRADNVVALFNDVPAAVAAAASILDAFRDARAAPDSAPALEGSIGIGYGHILQLAPDWIAGDEVNRAAKLGEDIAGRDEILLTPAAWVALGGDWAADHGRARVGGLEIEFHRLSPAS